ncbi:hypothetical protein HanRHA438_Chr03g0102081 [Helianthus annuus]|nr:hypothetical protein HanRHA438_Chr03g0102081 [Helianthus annuus]
MFNYVSIMSKKRVYCLEQKGVHRRLWLNTIVYNRVKLIPQTPTSHTLVLQVVITHSTPHTPYNYAYTVHPYNALS